MKRFIILIIFLLIGTGIYFNSLRNGFHYDDGHHIFENSYIRTLTNIPLFFTQPRTLSIQSTHHLHYRPLVLTSYAINYSLGALNRPGYHMVNLGFHIGSAFLVFLILQTMLDSYALFVPLAAGLLFLTTPYNTEVVNYITARSTVMCTFFYLMAFYFWVKYREFQISNFKFQIYYYTASLFAFTLAMLTKEIAITLPVMLVLYDMYFVHNLSPLSPRRYLFYLPFAIVGGITGIVFRMIFFRSFIEDRSIESLSHFSIKIKVLAKYFTHMALPVNLSVEHTIEESPDIYFFLSLILLTSLLVLAYFLWKSRDLLARTASFFIAWFFIVLLPTSFVHLAAPYQENRGYPSAIGFVVLAAVGLDRLIRRIPSENRQTLIGYSLISLLAVILSIGVVQRNRVWLNDETLWSDVLKKYPSSSNARLALGRYNRASGQIEEALKKYQAIVENDPNDSNGLANLGLIYLKMGELEKAEGFFVNSLKFDHGNLIANIYMAKILESRGEFTIATMHLMRALYVSPDNIQLTAILIDLCDKTGNLNQCYERFLQTKEGDPHNPAIRRALGLIYMKRGQWKDASGELEAVLSYMPDDPKTLLDLGFVYFKMGKIELAEQRHLRAIAINPQDHAAYNSLAIIYQGAGRLDESLALYKKVLEINPESYRIYNNVGLIYSAKGENEKAIDAFRTALEYNPSYHLARFNLAKVYARVGKKNLAIQEYKEIVSSEPTTGNDKAINMAARKRLADLGGK